MIIKNPKSKTSHHLILFLFITLLATLTTIYLYDTIYATQPSNTQMSPPQDTTTKDTADNKISKQQPKTNPS